MALGVSPAQLAIRPLLLGAQIALAGAIFGIGIGLLAGDLFRGVLEELLPLPVTRTPFEFEVFARGAMLGLLLPVLATAIPVWRGVRLSPIEAIRIGFRSARSSGIAALGKHLRLPGSALAQLPLRNALRAPRRTLTTALAIGAVVTVIVAFLGFVDSFLATVDRSEAEVAQQSPDRVTVTLERFAPIGGAAVSAVERADGVEVADPGLVLPGALKAGPAAFDASISLVDFDSAVWHPTVVEGRPPQPGERGVLIAEEAARDLGVGLGDSIAVEHPRRGPGGSFVLATTPMTVTGVHPNPFRTFAYIDRSQASRMGLANLANQISVLPRAGVSDEQLARRLFGVAGIAAVERATATTDFVRERLDDFIGVLRLTVAFALALALLIAFNSSSISADERARETATMLAYGVRVRGALGLSIGESLITGLLGTGIGIAGGIAVIGWVVDQTLPDTLPDLGLIVSLSANSVLVAALVGVLAVALAPLLTARRILRMDVPSTLRVVE
jgi:putative ABC transport system permease protein